MRKSGWVARSIVALVTLFLFTNSQLAMAGPGPGMPSGCSWNSSNGGHQDNGFNLWNAITNGIGTFFSQNGQGILNFLNGASLLVTGAAIVVATGGPELWPLSGALLVVAGVLAIPGAIVDLVHRAQTGHFWEWGTLLDVATIVLPLAGGIFGVFKALRGLDVPDVTAEDPSTGDTNLPTVPQYHTVAQGLDIGGGQFPGDTGPVTRTPAGWDSYNIDPSADPTKVGNINTQGLPWPDNSFPKVDFTHFPFDQLTPRAISQAYRVLQPGGELTITTGVAADPSEITAELRAAGFKNVGWHESNGVLTITGTKP